MAVFDTAYNTYVKPSEGGYAFVAGDKGGETYAGIARNYWGSWSGWPYIDQQKKASGGTIVRNKMFPALDSAVKAFYKAMWDRSSFGQIGNQDIANLLFDYHVNSGATAIRAIQRLVKVTADGAMGPQTIAAINKANASDLYAALRADRKGLYEKLATQPGQAQFFTGWMARLNSFPTAIVAGTSILAVLGIGLLAWYLLSGVPDTKKENARTA